MKFLNILNSFIQLKAKNPVRKIEGEIINKLGAWIYYDGVSQGDP
jgi:hypothetical protein